MDLSFLKEFSLTLNTQYLYEIYDLTKIVTLFEFNVNRTNEF